MWSFLAFFALVVLAAPAAYADGEAPESGSAQESARLRAAPGDGLTVELDRFSLTLKGRVQLRARLDVPQAGADGSRELTQRVLVSTARLALSGHLLVPALTYAVQLGVAPSDFRDGSVSPLFDAYLQYAAHRDLRVRVGQFFVPFDRLRTVREWGLQMVDRPAAVWELTLDRDIGVMVYSERFLGDRSPLAYRVAAFGGGGPNASGWRAPGGLVVGRLELRPLGPIDDDVEGDLQRRARPALSLGIGAAKNFGATRLRSNTGPALTGGATDYSHLAVDLVFKWRGAALSAALLARWSSVDAITSTDAEGAQVLERLRPARGAVIQASYAFARSFELAARLAELWTVGATDAAFEKEVEERGRELGLGASRYLNGHKLKIQAGCGARLPRGAPLSRAALVAQVSLDASY